MPDTTSERRIGPTVGGPICVHCYKSAQQIFKTPLSDAQQRKGKIMRRVLHLGTRNSSPEVRDIFAAHSPLLPELPREVRQRELPWSSITSCVETQTGTGAHAIFADR